MKSIFQKPIIMHGTKINFDINDIYLSNIIAQFLSAYDYDEHFNNELVIKIRRISKEKSIMYNKAEYLSFSSRGYQNSKFYCAAKNTWFEMDSEKAIITGHVSNEDLNNKKNFIAIITFLLTELLTRIFFKRRWFPVHAAAVENKGKAFIIMGHPGVGKSTICMRLIARGFRLLSDERPLLSMNLSVRSFLRPINIKRDVIKLIERELNINLESLNIYSDSTSKVAYTLDKLSFINTVNESRVAAIFVLEKAQEKGIFSPRLINNIEAMKKILEMNYAWYATEEIEKLIDLAKVYSMKIPIFNLPVNYDDDWIEQLHTLLTNFKGGF